MFALVWSLCAASADAQGTTRKPPVRRPPPRRTAPVPPKDIGYLAREVWKHFQLQPESRPVREEVVQQIIKLGPNVVPIVLQILIGKLEAPPNTPNLPKYQRTALESASAVEYREQVLFAVLAAMPADSVLESIALAAVENIDAGSELVALRALASVRDLRAVDLWLKIAGEAKTERFATEKARRLASAALANLLHGTQGSYRRVNRILANQPRHVGALLAQAVESTADLQSIGILIRLLGRCDYPDGEIVRAIAKLARSPYLPVREDDFERLRAFLDDANARMRADTAVALGGLCDPGACPKLLEMLADSELMIRASARSALERMSRVRLGDSAEDWKSWYESEREWQATRLTEMVPWLSSADDLRMSLARDEIARHPLFRHELASEIAPLSADKRAEVAVSACQMLGSLDSLVGVAYLVQALDGRPAGVHRAAWTALKSVSNRVLPPISASWRETLDLVPQPASLPDLFNTLER